MAVFYSTDLNPVVHGEMYQVDNATVTTINTVNVWEEIGNFSAGSLLGVSYSTNSMTLPLTGDYEVNYSLSSSAATANKTFEIAVSVNDVIDNKTKTKRRYSTADVGVSAGNAVLSVSSGDVIKLEIRNITDATNITVVNCNVYVVKL